MIFHTPCLIAKDIESVRLDLSTPSVADDAPAPGKRVWQPRKEY